jgi:hypothetical protein
MESICRPQPGLFVLKLESPRLVEITMKSRGLKKFGERGGRTVIFLLRPNYLLGAVEFVLGDKE